MSFSDFLLTQVETQDTATEQNVFKVSVVATLASALITLCITLTDKWLAFSISRTDWVTGVS